MISEHKTRAAEVAMLYQGRAQGQKDNDSSKGSDALPERRNGSCGSIMGEKDIKGGACFTQRYQYKRHLQRRRLFFTYAKGYDTRKAGKQLPAFSSVHYKIYICSLNSFSIDCLILLAVDAETFAIFTISWLEHQGLDIISNISLAITLMPPFKRYSINHLFIDKSQVFKT